MNRSHSNASWLRTDAASLDYLAETYRDLASFGKSSGDLELAINSFRQAKLIIDGLLQDDPDNENFIRTLATCHTEEVGLYLDLLNNQAALESATKAEAVYLSFANGPSPRPEDFAVATILASRRGQALTLLGRMDDARVAYETGIERGGIGSSGTRRWISVSCSRGCCCTSRRTRASSLPFPTKQKH